MGEIVNLRRARKNRARAEKDAEAERNRVAFGRSKVGRRASEAEADLVTRRLDGHRREPDGGGAA